MTAPPGMTAIESGAFTGSAWTVEWCIVNAPLWGATNGYVRIPEGHPWFGLNDYDHEDIKVEVHGGLTYASHNWIGFDTLHAFDVWPGSPEYMQERDDWSIEWTQAKVASETRSLAEQVAGVAPDRTVVDA